MSQLRSAISSSRALLGYPQVTTYDVIIARILLESGVMLFVFAFVLSMAHLFGYHFRIENPLGVLGVCLALLALGSGFGFVLAFLVDLFTDLLLFAFVGFLEGFFFGFV